MYEICTFLFLDHSGSGAMTRRVFRLMDRHITNHPGAIWGHWKACANEYFSFSTVGNLKYVHFQSQIAQAQVLWPGGPSGRWDEIFKTIQVQLGVTEKPAQRIFLIFCCWKYEICTFLFLDQSGSGAMTRRAFRLMDRNIKNHLGAIWGYWKACPNEYFSFSTVGNLKYVHFQSQITPARVLWPGGCSGW